jgi:hypothetical protein
MSQLVSCTYCQTISPLPWVNDRCPNCGGEAATVAIDNQPIACPGYAPVRGAVDPQLTSLWDELQAAKTDVALLSRECERLERENERLKGQVVRMENTPNLVRKRRCG